MTGWSSAIRSFILSDRASNDVIVQRCVAAAGEPSGEIRERISTTGRRATQFPTTMCRWTLAPLLDRSHERALLSAASAR
jgi:hypothetical protein